jgi:hypothetical protein
MSEKSKLTPTDLELHLKQQYDLLVLDARDYDNGLKVKSKELARRISLLIQSNKKHPSLLDLFDKKSEIKYLNTGEEYDPKNTIITESLVAKTNKDIYYPLLDNYPPFIKNINKLFKEWYNQIVICDGKGNKFSRKDIIIFIAHNDGGGHISFEIDKKYYELSRNNSMGWLKNGETVIEGPENGTIRQIAHEIIRTLESNFPNIIKERMIIKRPNISMISNIKHKSI